MWADYRPLGRAYEGRGGERDYPGGDRECNLCPLILNILPPFSIGTFYLLGMRHSVGLETFDHGGHGIRKNHEKAPPTSPHHAQSQRDKPRPEVAQ